MNKRRIIRMSGVIVVLLCLSFLITKIKKEAEKLALRNASDSLILFAEFATEPGGNYTQAEIDYGEMLRRYVRHMQSRRRDIPSFLMLLFVKGNIANELERIAKDLFGLGLSEEEVKIFIDGSEADKQAAARWKIEAASAAIAKFFSNLKPFKGGPIPIFEPEVISEEIQDAIRHSLETAHEKAEIYANNINLANSEVVYQANRKAIVYLYLVRFKYREIVAQEELERFRTDLNRTIYYNQALQHSEKINKDERSRLTIYSYNELRRLRLLQLIIDNDIQQAHAFLQIGLSEKFFPIFNF